jgi:hypothetical protein
MTAQGSAYTRFKRAIQRNNFLGAEMTLREMRGVSLLEALDYFVLLAGLRPDRAPAAAVRWHGRFEIEASSLTLAESQLALAALTNLCAGDTEAALILRRLARRVQPSLVPRAG